MSTPDPTAYNLVLAGQYSAASDVIRAGWPQAILDLVQVSARAAASSYQALSGTSINVTSGTKVFTLTVPHGWPAGTPVYIIAAADPTVVMIGSLAGDETTGGVITVTVTSASGAGTYSSWRILLLQVTSIVVTPPVGETQGGTGAVTFDSARSNLQVGRTRVVLGVTVTPPSSPGLGDLYAVKLNATGAWASRGGSWATWGGSAWTFAGGNTGEQSMDVTTGLLYSVPPAANDWLLIASQSPGRATPLRVAATPLTLTSDQLNASASLIVYVVDGSGGNLTLPTVVSVPRVRLTVLNKGASSLTLNVASGGTLDGTTTKVITSGSRVTIFAYTDGTTTDWLTV